MTIPLSKAIAYCRDSITKGSKSFSLAARLFPKSTRDAAFCLYGWCRFCDDEIDSTNKEGKEARLKILQEKTKACYTEQVISDPVFRAFQFIVKKYRIPVEYPMELLEGMAMDVQNQSYRTFSNLHVYCYRVAGTVGLMMSHIMGLSDEKALKNACDMGMAMQLTNIARDIREDYEMGRIYLPQEWLAEMNIPERELMEPQHRAALVDLVKRLLNEADKLYEHGDRGLLYLPFQMALAISSARSVYSEIGHLILKRGGEAWSSRTIVSTPRKIYVMLKGLMGAASDLGTRWKKPWTPVPINSIWRIS